jgi:serine/threonine protein phosphatase PrpC
VVSEAVAGRRPAVRPPASWHISTASARGSIHTGDAPNQDSVTAAPLPTVDGSPGWVAAVSDGHGGRRYVRSDRGSRIATRLAVELLAAAAAEAGPGVPPASIVAAAMPKLVDAWRHEVLEDVRREPFTDEEATRSGAAAIASEPLIAYGATLLLLLSRGGDIALGQLGDGDVIVRAATGGCRPIPGDDRLVGGETTSLCLPTAEHDFRFTEFSAEDEVDLVLLATDGYANSFADEQWWPVVIDDLARFLTDHGPDVLDRELPVWLGESAVVGGDDVTVALLTRSPMGPATRGASDVRTAHPVRQADTVPLPARGEVPDPGPEPDLPAAGPPSAGPVAVDVGGRQPVPRDHRRFVAVSAVLTFLLVAAAVIVVVLVTRHSSSPTTPAPIGSTQTPQQKGGTGPPSGSRTR